MKVEGFNVHYDGVTLTMLNTALGPVQQTAINMGININMI
jgi:hypothetical protein